MAKEEVLKRFTLTTDDDIGSLEVLKDDVRLTLGKTVVIKRGYVGLIEKTAALALNKVAVEFSYYDLFGNKEAKRFMMAENDYRALKKMLGK